ncbi:hypothetical protein ACFL00_03565 [Pseudomonadota bacterium]
MKTFEQNLPSLKFRAGMISHAILMAIWLISLSSAAFASDPFKVAIKNAEYDAEVHELKVEVSLGKEGKKVVRVLNDRTDQLLAQKTTRRAEIRFQIGGLTGNGVPCEVRVESKGMSDISSVANTPADCGGEPPPPPPPPPPP